ncbi:MAG: DUF6511 domain-containing protein [Pseudomonadota bacterium]
MTLTPTETETALRHTRQKLAQFIEHQGKAAAFMTLDKNQVNGVIRVIVEEWREGVRAARGDTTTFGVTYADDDLNDELPPEMR